MRVQFLFLISLIFPALSSAQTQNEYSISFENAIHHEARITAVFSNLDDAPLELRMSKTSPGRYAIHNFAKNVYSVRAFDSKGRTLELFRPNPHQWDVYGHDGTVVFEYTLFANRGDGTYSQVDESHAILNIPSTFIYPRDYMHRSVQVNFDVREDLNWEIATQLKREGRTTYSAPDGYYFMDSPVLLADYHLREEMVDDQLIRLALHTPANDNEVNEYFSKVMAIVETQRDIFGELPQFDFGEYTFLAVYMPNASGDGMEHRNSTIITNRKPKDSALGETSISTVSHEFFHVWNVERIRPASLEPFDFEETNMSDELWFAEGFTSYYTSLTLVRAGIRTEREYVEGLARSINRVFNSPGIQFFNPIQMSQKAPFVDAATSIDPNNFTNTFVSYYTYGSVLGLALDLSLRTRTDNKNLDDFFRLIWDRYGKTEIPYSIKDLESVLEEYTDSQFTSNFFDRYIYDSQMPDFEGLFRQVGINFDRENPQEGWLGGSITKYGDEFRLSGNARIGTPLYEAGIQSTDKILSIAGRQLNSRINVEELIANRRPGQTVNIIYERWGEQKTVRVRLGSNPDFSTELIRRPSRNARALRSDWLGSD